MYSAMVGYGMDNNYSSLFPNVTNRKPDDSFSEIPYEKGFQFLFFMETLLGETDMQEMLQGYINTHTL